MRSGFAAKLHGALLVSLAAIACMPGCTAPERGRVLLIGIDGATMKLAGPLIDEGMLPHLAKFVGDGVAGNLRSQHPLHSPRIWNTISTGAGPEKHGIVSFVWKDEQDAPHLYVSTDRKVPALWDIAAAHGKRVGVVNWWTTYPPTALEDGTMVSDHFFPEQIAMIRRTFKDFGSEKGSLVHPESWNDRAFELLESDDPVVAGPDPFGDKSQLPSWVRHEVLDRQFTTDAAIARVALGLDADFHPDLMMVFFPGIDRISHWLWGGLEDPSVYPPGLQASEPERQAEANALIGYYQYTDRLIGRLLENYGENDLVMIVSDHGFEAGVTLMLLSGTHDSDEALDGVVFARGPGIPRGKPPGPMTVNDVAPTVLAWLGIPWAEDMDGRPAAFLEGPSPEPVSSWNQLEIEHLGEKASGLEDSVIEQLRGLGYLELPAGERPEGSADDAPPDGD